MKYTTYNVQTGQVDLVYDIADPEQIAANLAGRDWILGDYGTGYYIENNQPVVMPADPSTVLAPHEFDYVTKSWQLNHSAAEFVNRSERNKLLSDIDRVNAIWYASLSTDQQQQLITYRQALLDVPQQSGFPAAVNWPAKPTWL
jgi:hypothetical protein